MIGRVLLAALLAGIAAGLFMGVIQQARLTPIILAAEVYEVAAEQHSHDDAAVAQTAESTESAHSHEDNEWAPSDGIERTLYTTLASVVAGAAFAAILAGISLLVGIPITPANGLIWGLCGFLAATLAPAAGLPPELPGMPAGDLEMRQLWWVGCIAATAAGIYLIATRRQLWPITGAVVLIALPHLIGAPQPLSHETTVPAGLSASFAANAIAAGAAFWCVLGVFLGFALQKLSHEIHAT